MQIEQTQQCHNLMVKQKYPDNKFTCKDKCSCVISVLNLHRCGLSNRKEINDAPPPKPLTENVYYCKK